MGSSNRPDSEVLVKVRLSLAVTYKGILKGIF